MTPGDLVHFTKVRLKDGREVKAMVEEPKPSEPITRALAFQMLLAASLLMEEAEPLLVDFGRQRYERERRRLVRRSELLRERMEDAIARESR